MVDDNRTAKGGAKEIAAALRKNVTLTVLHFGIECA